MIATRVRAVPTLCRLVVLVIALAIALPSVALGQTTTIPPSGGGDLSDDPPVDLDGNGGGSSNGGSSNGGSNGGSSGGDDGSDASDGSRGGREGASELPNTGSDPRLLFLAGAALVLIGVGLRLRSADADLY